MKIKRLKVKELMTLLAGMNPELEVVVDGDENGYCFCEKVELYVDEQVNELHCNIISSAEA